MVVLYSGAFCVYPKEKDIIAKVEDGNWVELVKANGLELAPYSRIAKRNGKTYIDFGSWSKFIVMD